MAESAELIIRDAIRGEVVLSQDITSFGDGHVVVNMTTQSAGVYWYTLLVDGQPVETKKFVMID